MATDPISLPARCAKCLKWLPEDTVVYGLHREHPRKGDGKVAIWVDPAAALHWLNNPECKGSPITFDRSAIPPEIFIGRPN
jgi:hypothetical protein